MPKIFKFATVLALVLAFVGALSAAEKPSRDPSKSHLLTAHALITDGFSGLELLPLSNAIRTWMKETSNDIVVLPPEQSDSFFYKTLLRGEGDSAISDIALSYLDDSKLNPWREGCRNTFYVIRTTSRDPLVKVIDDRDGDPSTGVLAFTYPGCLFKYIVIVADRMESEEFMYGTMLHELGHMWGLPDNERGLLSVMNGMYPMSPCVTKTDLFETYGVFGKGNHVPKAGGCVPDKKSGK